MLADVHRSPGVHRFLLTTTAMTTTRATLAGLASVAVLAASPVGANPLGGNVVGGTATIQGQGSNAVTINQSSQNAIVNWSTFNIGKGETTTFNQAMGSASIALNRVIGGQGPSFLDGTLTANGRVFIINGDGILFGPNSSINTSGFLATTHDIRNEDFMAGKYNFNIPGNPNASIVNLGTITATNGGFAALVAPGVRNSGTITATLGTVSLAAGNAFTLDFYGDRLITLAVNDQIASVARDVQTGETLKSLVHNTGKLSANGGRVELTAAAARAVVDSVINNKGVIEANAVGTRNGKIVLSAATGAGKPAGAPVQTVALSGRISAAGKDKGTKGGTVVVTGESIVLSGATIDASGDAGGGKVMIGGDTGGGHPSAAAASIELAKLEAFVIPTATSVSVDGASVINASATGAGNGGKVVLWSDQQTTFAGTILARGGASGGDGGFVETSSHGVLNFTGPVDTRAPLGAAGTLLLDPYDVVINSIYDLNGSFVNGVWTPNGNTSYLSSTNLQNQLGLGNVVVTTLGSSPGSQAGNITVTSSVTWANNSSLTLSAYNSILVQSSVTITNTGGGNLVLRSDNSGTGTGTVQFLGGSNQVSLNTGTTSIYYNPSCGSLCNKYQNPTDYSGSVSGKLTAYMLLNSAGDLSTMGTLLGTPNTITGNYALGRSFSATGFSGFNIGAHFAGLFDGNGGLGVSSTISDLTLGGSTGPIGLFPFIDAGATVRNVNLDHVTITAGSDLLIIGPVAGQNNGTISNVNVLSLQGNSTVNGGAHSAILAGGLAGQNLGIVTGSSANVAVTVGDASDLNHVNIAGGLVASNFGAITGSSASGTVSGGAFSFAGGLVGQNGLNCNSCNPFGPGTITGSFATGTVSVTGASAAAGGLVGTQAKGSTITDSQAFGTMSAGPTGAGNDVLSSNKNVSNVGGLVGSNNGSIVGTTAVSLSSSCTAGASFSCASGTVTVGSGNNGGGLVGGNKGTITQAFATGKVGGADVSGIQVGGLVGENLGTVLRSFATGNVSAGDSSLAGGLVGGSFSDNTSGLIVSSTATGNVTVGNLSFAGGLAGTNAATIQNSTASGAVIGGSSAALGGLVGFAGTSNTGFNSTISNSSASGNVSGGAFSSVGGLVGQNGLDGNCTPCGPATITSSFATGAVSVTGASAAAGGLVGTQAKGSTITDSQAFGNVSAGATGTGNDVFSSNKNVSKAGGLVGFNEGSIIGTTAVSLSSSCTAGASFSCASGAVTVGSGNNGGGLVGRNFGTITQAFATGKVGGAGVGGLEVGGLVGENIGIILRSFATGSVSAGDLSLAGGLVGGNFPCCGSGLVGVINGSGASGTVTVGNSSIAGGLAGTNSATIQNSTTSGAVNGGSSILGGLVGFVSTGDTSFKSTISNSSATGAVTSTGPNSIVGGFAGFSGGTITSSSSSGPVTGTSDSYLGGFAGINTSLIQDSSATATATVTGTGSGNFAGGFVGLNFGLIDPSHSAGNVTSGPNSTVGSFVGANAAIKFSNGLLSNVLLPGGSPVIGTVSSDSSGTGSAIGGAGSTVGSQVGQSYPVAGLPGTVIAFGPCSSNFLCGVGTLFDPSPQAPPPPPTPPTPPAPPAPPQPQVQAPLQPPQQAQIINNLTGNLTLVSLSPSSVDVLPYPPLRGPSRGPQQQPVGEPRLFAVPPRGETRFVMDEVLLMVDCDTPQSALDTVAREMRLTITGAQCLTQTHMNLLRLHINSGQTVADVIRGLARYRISALAQADFVYHTMQDRVAQEQIAQDLAQDPGLAGRNQEGDSAQYALTKLGLIDIHRLIKGTNIPIAVIDSQIDVKHPDLEGVFADQYDAVGGAAEAPHAHGTGMAGAIAAHRRLMGIAPAARIYAIHAFSSGATTADSTTFNILKGLDWAASKGVRVINMSFAGPRDPSMERALKTAHDKGIVLIAAAGNAGPKSPPLFPGADPNVIAVTATDANDKIFAGANRGRYIAVAAPGVDILVPAPDNTYQLTTGTSVSSAEVAGIAALLLERNPNLTPEDIRKILTTSAKHLGPKERDDDFGSGLVDPSKAIQDAGELKPVGQPARR
jgi:filamentous hemagglutinin family protein